MTRKQLARFLVEATKGVFDMMIPIPLSIGKAADSGKGKSESGVSSIIGIAGDFSALVKVHTDAGAALDIASALLDEDIPEINEDVEDAVGELTNMIAGGLKGKFAEFGAKLELAIPSVVTGTGYTIKQPVNVAGLRVPFLLAGEKRFEVTLIIESRLVEES